MSDIPSYNSTAFSCPHCDAKAHQLWHKASARETKDGETAYDVEQEISESLNRNLQASMNGSDDQTAFHKLYCNYASGKPFVLGEDRSTHSMIMNVYFTDCFNCKKLSIWVRDRIVYPATKTLTVSPANPDMPEDVKSIYNEAGQVLSISPRGAAALIRLALEKLLVSLNIEGRTINQKIATLVNQGLDEKVQKALDAVRVIGNEAVHPGQIDIDDDAKTAIALFNLVNFISEKLISQPRQIDEIYSILPSEKVSGIVNRDKK